MYIYVEYFNKSTTSMYSGLHSNNACSNGWVEKLGERVEVD